jgi:tRNA(His) 5'-end guanylyltransferase
MLSKIYNEFLKLLSYDINYENESINEESSLRIRMKNLESKQNDNSCHPYKPHIVSLKSRKLLNYLNKITSFEKKFEMFENYNKIMENVCSKLYDRFDPHLIYTFNNEIHLVFYFNDDGEFVYDGDINKTLTNVVSYASVIMTIELLNNNLEADFTFEGTFTEFDVDYETLNYLIWRQSDCKRNIVNLLYKCYKNDIYLEKLMKDYPDDLKIDLSPDGKKVKDLEKLLNYYHPNYSEQLKNLSLGTIFKKKIIQKTNNDEIVLSHNKNGFEITSKRLENNSERKELVNFTFCLHDNFSEIMDTYIIEKYL